ncbi:unnamed protein product [Rodentolepis nana]|uniref:Calponin-homology (CH) domain-containing protein n=1 Tax=Rodentolepis nana TaxID=102285 RepID=A0A0R3TGN1_RODNA|nr:unnamed protein product [Rodentolepis nana]
MPPSCVTSGVQVLYVTKPPNDLKTIDFFCCQACFACLCQLLGDFEAVRALSPTERVRLAFDAAGRLGVARVFVDPCEVTRGRGGAPDRLSMMTYLHQLRTVLTAAAFAKESAEMSERANANGEVNNTSVDGNNEVHEKEEEGSKDSTKKSKRKKTKQRFNSGSGSASERYEQLLNKARNLLESTKTSDKTDSSMTSANVDANGESNPKPTEKKEVETDHSTSGNLKTRRLKISNLKLFSDGMESHLTPENSPRKSSSTSASSKTSPYSLSKSPLKNSLKEPSCVELKCFYHFN